MARHARAIVAGTFDRLHDGHFAMLHTGFALGAHVELWVRALRVAVARDSGEGRAACGPLPRGPPGARPRGNVG